MAKPIKITFKPSVTLTRTQHSVVDRLELGYRINGATSESMTNWVHPTGRHLPAACPHPTLKAMERKGVVTYDSAAHEWQLGRAALDGSATPTAPVASADDLTADEVAAEGDFLDSISEPLTLPTIAAIPSHLREEPNDIPDMYFTGVNGYRHIIYGPTGTAYCGWTEFSQFPAPELPICQKCRDMEAQSIVAQRETAGTRCIVTTDNMDGDCPFDTIQEALDFIGDQLEMGYACSVRALSAAAGGTDGA